MLSVLNEEDSVVVSRDSDQLVTVSQSSKSEGRQGAKIMFARVTLEKLAGANITKVPKFAALRKSFKKYEN